MHADREGSINYPIYFFQIKTCLWEVNDKTDDIDKQTQAL